MNDADRILDAVDHRPTWKIPEEDWVWYQEWNRSVFLHWKIDPDVLRPLIPDDLELHLHDGQAWVSLVGFTMERIRPRRLPSMSAVSNFHEINIRTYVTDGTHHGVYFLSIEAQKQLSAMISRAISGLPYQKATMRRNAYEAHSFMSENRKTGSRVSIDYTIGNALAEKTALDSWLTERYYLYVRKGTTLYRHNIHHGEWPLQRMDIRNLDVSYNIQGMELHHGNVELAHYSDGVEVIAWPQRKLGSAR